MTSVSGIPNQGVSEGSTGNGAIFSWGLEGLMALVSAVESAQVKEKASEVSAVLTSFFLPVL